MSLIGFHPLPCILTCMIQTLTSFIYTNTTGLSPVMCSIYVVYIDLTVHIYILIINLSVNAYMYIEVLFLQRCSCISNKQKETISVQSLPMLKLHTARLV